MPRPTSFALGAVTVLLGLNLAFAASLWQASRAQGARLARLEDLVRSTHRVEVKADVTSDHGATREERVASLLAVAGNADESKRVLEAVPTPEAAEMIRTLLERPAASDRNAALDALFRQIAGSDPDRAVALLDQVQEPTLRPTLAVRVTNLWIEQAPDAAARWLGQAGDGFFPREALDAQLARASTRWAAYAPAGATQFLAARATPGRDVLAAVANTAAEWGRQNPAAALAWVGTLPAADPHRLGLTQSILAGWAEREPARAASYLQDRVYDGGEGSELYASTVGLVADRWASVDPAAASQWAAGLPSRRARRDATRRVAAAWAATDLPGASRWAATLAADPARPAAWQAVINAWPGNDLDQEGAWVGSLPAGSDRDEAVALHASRLAPADPVKALTWARSIGEPTIQARSVGSILAGWERIDLAAARNWAAANDVTLPIPSR